MARAHTAVSVALVAAVPLLPLGLWVYARAASVDRGAQVRHARQLLQEAAPLPGARNLGFSVYEQRAWEGEGLVPISSYTVETAYRLPRSATIAAIVGYYRHELTGWRQESAVPDATFRRGGDAVSIDITEYRDAGTLLSEYGVIVSQ